MSRTDPFKVLLVYPNLTMMLVPSLAIAIFTRILKDANYSVELFDSTHYVAEENSSPQNRVRFLQARNFDEVNDLGVRIKTDLVGDYRRMVQNFSPDVILYSVVEDCYRQTVSLMKAISDLPIPHLVGGVYPTAAPEVCISNQYINAIGIGEGEQIIIDFCEAIRLGEVTTEILSQDQFTAGNLCRFFQHDYATIAHSASVAFYAGIMAADLGMKPSTCKKLQLQAYCMILVN